MTITGLFNMLKILPLTRLIASCFLGIFFARAEATIVRMDFDFGAGTVTDQVYIELFDSKAPGTVANFLNYVEDATGRRYDTTFIHRSVAGFIVQGGGLTFDKNVSSAFTEQATALDRLDPPIKNEFDPSDTERSNIRGTIAMAKVGGNPDSATSGWFYNLSDNSANLDTQNGGFTVFARVLCESTPAPVAGCDNMNIVEKLATAGENLLSIEALAPFPLDTVPLVNHTAGTAVADINLIRLRNVEVLNLVQPSALDFGFSPFGISNSQTITVENQTDFTFTILSVAANILPPFSILSDDCSNKLLGTVTDNLASRTCSITVSYQPTQAGESNSSFRIKTDHAKLPSLTVWVSGSGVPQAPTISFTPALGPDLELGNLLPGATERTFDLQISNLGAELLTVSPQPFTGAGTENLSVTNGCTLPIAAGDSCIVSITFSPITPGIATDAQLEITTNDPTTPAATIRITGSSNSDSDGVPDIIEAAVSTTGDGNGDGIADILQDNVTSLPTILGDYITLETEVGILLQNVQAIENPSPDRTPRLQGGTLNFNHGFFSFQLDNVPVGGTASVTLYLPEGQTVSNYFKFGLLPSDIITEVPFRITRPTHWYSFDYDGLTGAQINGNRITLYYKDGGRGDDDLAENGRISDPGGPATISLNTGSSGGGGGGCSLHQTTNSRELFPIDFALLLLMLYPLHRIRQRYTENGVN